MRINNFRVALVLLFVGLVVGAAVYGVDQYREILTAAKTAPITSFDGPALYTKAFEIIRDTHIELTDPGKRKEWIAQWENYKDPSALETEAGTDKAIFEMMRSLEQRFDYYIVPQQTEAEQQQQDPSFVGIGITPRIVGSNEAALEILKKLPKDPTPEELKPAIDAAQSVYKEFKISKEHPLVVAGDPIWESPAEKAGLKRGDRILEVDGRSLLGLTLEEVIPLVRGEKGTTVTLLIERAEGDSVVSLTVKVVRDKIVSPVAGYKDLGDGLAYVGLAHFESQYGLQDLQRALEKAAGARAIIFDLRGNPGGMLSQVIDMAGFFLEEGEVVETRGRNGEELISTTYMLQRSTALQVVVNSNEPDKPKVTQAKRQDLLVPLNIPIVVLVDENSYSAAELLSGMLQSERNAIVVGVPTGGKGVGQQVLALPFRRSLHVTNFQFLPGGKSIDWVGIIPDVIVKLPKWDPNQEWVDTQLDEAKKQALAAIDDARRLEQQKDEAEQTHHAEFEKALNSLQPQQ